MFSISYNQLNGWTDCHQLRSQTEGGEFISMSPVYSTVFMSLSIFLSVCLGPSSALPWSAHCLPTVCPDSPSNVVPSGLVDSPSTVALIYPDQPTVYSGPPTVCTGPHCLPRLTVYSGLNLPWFAHYLSWSADCLSWSPVSALTHCLLWSHLPWSAHCPDSPSALGPSALAHCLSWSAYHGQQSTLGHCQHWPTVCHGPSTLTYCQSWPTVFSDTLYTMTHCVPWPTVYTTTMIHCVP